MLSALLMIRRFAGAMNYALRDEDFDRILGAAALLVVTGTVVLALGADWSIVDGFYVAVATLTTSSILDPKLAITEPWLKVFSAMYILVGIGILVEVARRLGMGFIVAREELRAKAAARTRTRGRAEPGDPA
jgi:hypothetical protein